MADLDVRIEELKPMRVASVRIVSETPEVGAWEKLRAWAGAKGYLGDLRKHPVFGFNNPSPEPGQKEYGYEFWMKVDSDAKPEGDVNIKDFPGGLYAVVTHEGLPNPDIWMALWSWVQSSPYTWRKTNELERPHNPLAAINEMIFDLCLPIAGVEHHA